MTEPRILRAPWVRFLRLQGHYRGIGPAGQIQMKPGGGKLIAPFTFQEAGAGLIEFQALPGPEVPRLAGLREKTMRRLPFHGPGGQAFLSVRRGLFRCRDARPGTRRARLSLRKHSRVCGCNSFPRRCFFRATPLHPGHEPTFPGKREAENCD